MVENMSDGQVQTDQIAIINNLMNAVAALTGPKAPAIVPGGIYIRSQVEENLRISDKTLTWWIDNGLRVYRPATSKDLMFGEDIISFVRENPELLAPKSNQEKQSQRKKVRGK